MKRLAGGRIIFDKPSLTEQSHAKMCNVNNIVNRFMKTGVLDHVRSFQGEYRDVSDFGDYRSALERIQLAQDIFEALPIELKRKCENDPAKFLDYCADDANYEELTEIGILLPPRQKKKTEKPVIGTEGSSEHETKKDPLAKLPT